MTTRARVAALALTTLITTACGGDDGVAAGEGDGSGTLLVRASISSDDDTAEFEVDVERAGQDVVDAVIVISNFDDDYTLLHDGGGVYHGGLAGWADRYSIEVTAGDDWLDGWLDAPDLPVLVSPSPTEAFDPHLAENGVVVVEWDGDAAMSARVRVGDFEWEGQDEGLLEVPATSFQNEDQEVELRRRNEIALAGGAPGSSLSVSSESRTNLIVINPYD